MPFDLATAPVLATAPLVVGASVEFDFAGGYAPLRGTVEYAGGFLARVRGARGAVHSIVVNAKHGDVSIVMNGPKTRHVRAVRVLA